MYAAFARTLTQTLPFGMRRATDKEMRKYFK